MVLGSSERRSGLPGSASSSTRQRPFGVVGRDIPALIQEEGKPTMQDILHCKSRIQSELDRSEKLVCIRKLNKNIACCRFLLLFFIYYCDISVLCIYLLLLGVRLAYFICPDGLHHFVKDDLSVLKRYVCQVPHMLSLIYCLPGGMLSPTGV